MANEPWNDRWEKIKELDQGGQGTTFLVRSRSNAGLEAVLKVLKNKKSEQSRGRMAREVINLKLLAAAGGKVPTVLDGNTEQFQEPGTPLYFVMDYIAGRTLDQLLASDGPMKIGDAVDVALDICRTVQKGHLQEVLHRDLKPKNIIARSVEGRSQDVVIVDYGLSFNKLGDDDLTKTDEQFKNPFLALPETHALDGSRRDARSDLTAVCGVLLYCMTGKEPRVLLDEQNRPPHRRPGTILRELHPGDIRVPHLDSLFSRAFLQDLNARLQNISELITRLEAIRTAGSSNGVLDPVLFAAQASEDFLQKSRPAQLMGFKQIAGEVSQAVAGRFMAYQGKLGDFFVGAQPPVQLRLEELEAGETLVSSMIFTVAHKSDMQNVRGLTFRFVANGNEVSIHSHRVSVEYVKPNQVSGLGSQRAGMVTSPPQGFQRANAPTAPRTLAASG